MSEVTLQQAVATLDTLPVAEKQYIATVIIEYGPKLAELYAAVDEGYQALNRADYTDVASVDHFVAEIEKGHEQP